MPTFLERIKARRFSAASSSAVSIGVNGESESRLDVDAGGKLLWGSGSATGDTNLYRSAANTLKSDDAFTAASLAVTSQFTLPTSDGSADQVMVTDGSGTVTWADQSGGGGSPGGSDGQVQYNNGGAFGGASSLYYDDVNNRVGIGTSTPAEVLDVSGNIAMSGNDRSIVFTGTGPNGIEHIESGSLEGALYYRTSPNSWSFEDGSSNKIAEFDTDDLSTTLGGNLTAGGNIDGPQDFTVGNGEGEFVLFQGSSNQVFVQSNGTYRAYWNSSGHYLPYADSSYDLGASSLRWKDAYTDSLTTGTATVTLLNHSGTSSRDKIRVWNSGTYAIGMQSGITFGPLNDYAMTFQMSNSSSRGFWWGDTAHGVNQGAMALSTIGELYVPTSIKVGYGETNTSDTYSYDLQVSTDIRLNNLTLTSVDADGSMRVQGSGGYIDIGPKNTTYCHIYTDRGSFYFNKTTLYANSTNNKIWHRGDLRGGAASVALNSTGYGTINHGLGATPDFAFVGARQKLSNDGDNQLSFPITSYNSTSITFRAYEINGDGNSNYTSSTIYNATVYVFWMAGNQ